MDQNIPIRGVNLGGWLVLEKWLTPSLFAGTDAGDEFTFMQTPGAGKRIEAHRRSFIRETDFKWLGQHGVNLVRIPVGYWLFEDIDGYMATVKYLDKAMAWAEKHNLRVIIDLHGVRGSQNGFDNSGKAGQAEWFGDKQAIATSIDILCRIANRYKDSSALWGIELLNEPVAKGHLWTLLRFYRTAYTRLRAILRPGTRVVFHDGFQPLFMTGALWPRKSHPVVMDVHWYAFPIGDKSLHGYLAKSAWRRKALIKLLQLWQPILVGEWSTVLPQRFFDAEPTNKHMELLATNATMQQQAYAQSAGWIYWNYKAEGDGMWNFRDLAERGVIDFL